jgi:hypothetical protein
MRVSGTKDHEDGLLSLDFIIGFTIFLIALIFVALMISGLLVHLQSRTIDYDAVAYRTAVVLVEDPGEPENWPLMDLNYEAERDSVRRLGLGVAKNYPANYPGSYPGVLKLTKVEKFFTYKNPPFCMGDDTFCKPDDYRDKVIFGDYPYQFNITLNTTLGTYTVGNIPPEQSHGYIKRIVKIQRPGSIQDIAVIPNGNQKTITIRVNFYELYTQPPPYLIDPLSENLTIFIQNFSNLSATPNLTDIQICKYPLAGLPGCIGWNAYDDYPDLNVTIDGIPVGETPPPWNSIDNNTTILLEGGLFPRIGYDEFSSIDTILTFDQNVTNQTLYYYNYTSGVTQPLLEPAVLEVRVW